MDGPLTDCTNLSCLPTNTDGSRVPTEIVGQKRIVKLYCEWFDGTKFYLYFFGKFGFVLPILFLLLRIIMHDEELLLV